MVEPIACALEQPQLADRMRSWEQLCEGSSVVVATPDGVRLDLPPAGAVGHSLLDLVAAERECCGWADWTVTSTASVTRLEVVAEGAGPAALHVMFRVAR